MKTDRARDNEVLRQRKQYVTLCTAFVVAAVLALVVALPLALLHNNSAAQGSGNSSPHLLPLRNASSTVRAILEVSGINEGEFAADKTKQRALISGFASAVGVQARDAKIIKIGDSVIAAGVRKLDDSLIKIIYEVGNIATDAGAKSLATKINKITSGQWAQSFGPVLAPMGYVLIVQSAAADVDSNPSSEPEKPTEEQKMKEMASACPKLSAYMMHR